MAASCSSEGGILCNLEFVPVGVAEDGGEDGAAVVYERLTDTLVGIKDHLFLFTPSGARQSLQDVVLGV